MGAWVQIRGEPWLLGSSSPWVVEAANLSVALARLGDMGVGVVSVSLDDAASSAAVVRCLKGALPLPEWCGDGWDSIDDAFEELRQGLRLPTALLVTGLNGVLARDLQLALETAVRLSELERAFSLASDQLLVIYIDNA